MKVELMERRMETVKKQADTIMDLENELAKVRKQERAYEEAMEQLQADLDALEQDNAKLKTLANNPERQASTAQVVEAEAVPTEGNLETSYLLEQVRDRADRCVDGPAELLSSRSMRSVALSDSCGRRIRSSRARTSSEKSRRSPSCLYPSRAHQHLHSYPQHSQTRTRTLTTSLGRHLHCARSQWSRSSSIVRSSSTPRPRASSICPCSRRRARTGSRRRRRGCRGRRPRRTSSSSARCRASGWADD